MIFTIESINKNLDLYEVSSSSNERMMVSAAQITMAMANGHEFTNAYLTRKGFAIKTSNGTRYVQLHKMTKEMEVAIVNRLNYIKQMEEQKKQQMTNAIKKGYVKPNIRNIKASGKIQGKNNVNQRIIYRGQVFLSPEQICRQFNRDVETFKALYNKGYSLDECLGLVPLRPEDQITPRSKTDKILDRMEMNRGE